MNDIIQIRFDDPEMDGLIEAIESEGLAYEIIGQPVVQAQPAQAADAATADALASWATSRDSDSIRTAKPTSAQIAAQYQQQCADVQAARAADLAAKAAQQEVPAFVVKVREDMVRARKMFPNDQFLGVVRCTNDGSWVYANSWGSRDYLPREAGLYFQHEQRTA